MKNILSFLIFAACVFYVSSCKEKNANALESEKLTVDQEDLNNDGVKSIETIAQQPNENLDSDKLLVLIKNMTKIRPEEVEGMKQDAEVIINHRYKETSRKSYAILEKDLWEYEFIFTGKEMSELNQFAGCWIDFSNDMTYNYGLYEDALGSGRYTYSIESGLLLLIDDAKNIKPQEFTAKVFDQTLVTIGNPIYKDNNYNAKLKRITEKPKK